MVLDASLNVNSLKDITSGRLAVNFEDSRGRLQSGSISVNGEKFNVSFASNGAATVKKNFEGFFGGIRTFFMGHTAKAQEIERKMNSIILANGWQGLQDRLQQQGVPGERNKEQPGHGTP